jgi:NAD-dependent DNA ligase
MEEQNFTFLSRDRLIDRAIDELIGICKGILFDGVTCHPEAVNLMNWLNSNNMVVKYWPASELYQQLPILLSGNSFSADDEAQFMTLLLKTTGSPEFFEAGYNASSLLPLCDPAPEVVFAGRVFVVTGNLQMGTRRTVIQAIEDLGGEVVLKNVRKDTDYLVIGDIGSRAWMHSTHGRKIEAAIELREQGTGIAIISEAHFMNYLQRNATN